LKLGETVYEKKTVTTFTGPAPRVYETRFVFDTFGRLLRLTYPDGEVLTNTYDSGGNLTSASGVKAVAASGQNHRYHYLQNMLYDKFEHRAVVEQGNGVKTAYRYDTNTQRLGGLTAVRQGNTIFQNLSYSYDKVGNILRLENNVALPHANDYGGPSVQRFEYDDLYRLTKAQGVFPANVNAATVDKNACAGVPTSHCRVYDLAMGYDSIHNILAKNQRDTRYPPGNTQGVVQKKTDYDFTYAYALSGLTSVRPHAPTHIGVRTYSYDLNGNQTGWTHDQNGTRRDIIWDDENRIQSVADNGSTKTYKYDHKGDRVIKRGPQGETVYVNQFFTDRPGSNGTKHVYAGTTRIASKLARQDGPNSNPAGNTPFEKDLYFYHPDHLGSSSYITDLNGKLYEHLEYFPFGEGWIEENSNVQRTPYLFTSKELDEETGLYYFGARYYDPRTSVWQSPDPILGRYVNGAPLGGVYNSINLALYTYGADNPIRFSDPDGRYRIVGHKYAPEAAALAVGLPPKTAEAIGTAAWAPDTDHRSATHFFSFFQPGHANDKNIHMLTGGDAKEAQKQALQKFQEVVDAMDVQKPNFGGPEQEALHALGDGFSHQDGSGKMYSSPLGHWWQNLVDIVRGIFGLPPKHDPDNPYVHPDRFGDYLGTLYDNLLKPAQKGGFNPRMSREEFIEAGMKAATTTHKDDEQIDNTKALIDQLKSQGTN
jgi:RHS repeat-associated protein